MRQSYQRAMSTAELTNAEMALLNQAEVPAEHDYNYEEDAEVGPGMGR